MKQIIINSEELQVRVAVVDDGKLQDFFMERKNKDRIVGSIYKGRIKNLEPSLQAAFVDIGVGKNAFLHYWDMIPATQEMLEEGEEDEEALKQRFDAAASAPAAESAVDAEVEQGGRGLYDWQTWLDLQKVTLGQTQPPSVLLLRSIVWV